MGNFDFDDDLDDDDFDSDFFKKKISGGFVYLGP